MAFVKVKTLSDADVWVNMANVFCIFDDPEHERCDVRQRIDGGSLLIQGSPAQFLDGGRSDTSAPSETQPVLSP